MERNRSSSITDRLQDVLGGVEDEIRRAEERLQLDVYSGTHVVLLSALGPGSWRFRLCTRKIAAVSQPTSPQRTLDFERPMYGLVVTGWHVTIDSLCSLGIGHSVYCRDKTLVRETSDLDTSKVSLEIF